MIPSRTGSVIDHHGDGVLPIHDTPQGGGAGGAPGDLLIEVNSGTNLSIIL